MCLLIGQHYGVEQAAPPLGCRFLCQFGKEGRRAPKINLRDSDVAIMVHGLPKAKTKTTHVCSANKQPVSESKRRTHPMMQTPSLHHGVLIQWFVSECQRRRGLFNYIMNSKSMAQLKPRGHEIDQLQKNEQVVQVEGLTGNTAGA